MKKLVFKFAFHLFTNVFQLTRAKFEQLVAEFINKTRPLCHKALEEAKISVSDIDEVFAVGGVTCIPKVTKQDVRLYFEICQFRSNSIVILHN